MTPRATYRIQFHNGFTFADAAALAPYFARLGISHLYASPILAARAGSMHGYDVIDHARINPELGGEEGFRALAATLREHDIGIILDIVPNHMAVGGADNLYWLDLLEKGRDSVFANLFDIDWEPAQPNLRDKVLVPFLGKPLAEALDDGDIKFLWDPALGKFAFAYADHRFPMRPEDYAYITQGADDSAQVPLEKFNDPLELRALLAQQNFRLAFWRDAGRRINWRRFFDIIELGALRIEDDGIFEMVHATVFRLYAEGLIDGLRIDHVDGLADPRAYCLRLRARLEALSPNRERRDPPYVVVEKILAAGETLPPQWRVDGTTGYDFMNEVSALQHDGAQAHHFAALWASISGRSADFEPEERDARCEILHAAFSGALQATATAFRELADNEAPDQLVFEAALDRLLQHFRAYRTYATGDNAEPAPGSFFDVALAQAEQSANHAGRAALSSIAATMRGEKASQGEAARDAVRRFNQLAAPVAAKAVEDTAFYRYGRFLSRNDVGFAPGHFAMTPEEFLATAMRRGAGFPHAMLTTATHDHKRGEDVRARLAALSEMPNVWEKEVRGWFELNAPLRGNRVSAGDEYQLYQTLLGCWPMDGIRTEEERADFTQRILQWREKSLREAKLQTAWSKVDAVFEQQNADFVRAVLEPSRSATFLTRLADFATHLASAGVLNSLAQCTLRYTCAGLPDLFQGTELWDLSLVDPDNRRPVDFGVRQDLLAADHAPSLKNWKSGGVKLALVRKLLTVRAASPKLFDTADMQPQFAHGPRAQNVVAFTRQANGHTLFVAVARLCARACMQAGSPLPTRTFWNDTTVTLPSDRRDKPWRNALDPEATIPSLDCASLFATLPVTVLIADV